MRALRPVCTYQWTPILQRASFLNSRGLPLCIGGNGNGNKLAWFLASRSRRNLHATPRTNALFRFPRFQFRFRPLPSYGILLAAQLVLIYGVVQQLRADDGHPGNESTLLNTSTFSSYTVARKENLSANSCILTLLPTALVPSTDNTATYNPFHMLRTLVRKVRSIGAPAQERQTQKLKDYHDELWKSGVWSIEVKQPQLMVARRYTPLPPPAGLLAYAHQSRKGSASRPGQIQLFVRREPQGEVSQYLHFLAQGKTVELRGGFVEYDIGDDVSEVVFVAGGTGIAPALSIARALALRGSPAQVRVLWANRRREDCAGGGNKSSPSWTAALMGSVGRLSPGASVERKETPSNDLKSTLVLQLDALESADRLETDQDRPNVSVRYFVDEEGSFIQKADIDQALRQKSHQRADQGSSTQHPQRRRLVLVAGPDGFVEHIAGPKTPSNGIGVQKPVGGLLGKVDLRGWQVQRL